MIRERGPSPISIGDLCMVEASGDHRIPVPYHLVVVIGPAQDKVNLGKRFMVRPVSRSPAHHSDRERLVSELVPLSAYGMRLAHVGAYVTGVAFLRVERDPSIEPEVCARTVKPRKWGNPYKPDRFVPWLDFEHAIDDAAVSFIHLPAAESKRAAA